MDLEVWNGIQQFQTLKDITYKREAESTAGQHQQAPPQKQDLAEYIPSSFASRRADLHLG